MCRFLAIDLDEKTWKKDALEIASAARNDGFQMAIERSFSGNGAHLWLFFNEEVPASKARELAFAFIDKACENSKTVSLKSYDRIFPTQDSVSQNGLGNLILMPLVKSAAFEVMKGREIGILEAATSFGKTVVAFKLIAERGERTLILVQSRKLLEQLCSQLDLGICMGYRPPWREKMTWRRWFMRSVDLSSIDIVRTNWLTNAGYLYGQILGRGCRYPVS
jgi:hypothetical protein